MCLVRAIGEIDLSTVAELDSALAQAQEDGHTHVVLDLWGVTFIDAVGLGVLLSARRRAEKGVGGFAVVAEPQGVVQTAFELTGLSAALSVYSTRAFATSNAAGCCALASAGTSTIRSTRSERLEGPRRSRCEAARVGLQGLVRASLPRPRT